MTKNAGSIRRGMSLLEAQAIATNKYLDAGKKEGSIEPLKQAFIPQPSRLTISQKICYYWSMMIIHPIGPFRCAWDLFVMLALTYTCIEVPITLAWDIELKLSDWSGLTALVIDIFLLTDIVINFRTAYFDDYDELHLIIAPKKIAKQFVLLFFSFNCMVGAFVHLLFVCLFF